MTGDLQSVKAAIAALVRGPEFLTVLALIDTEKGLSEPNTTPGPTQVFAGEKAVTSDQGFPVAEVIGVSTVYDASSAQVKDATHEVQVVWTHVGDDELTITAQLERLVRATRDLLWPSAGPIVIPGTNSAPVEIVREEYTGLMSVTGQSTFVKASATTLRVRTLTL